MPMIRVPRSPLSVAFGAWVTLLLLSIISYGQTTQQVAFSNVKIKNFGQMDERFFRGAQPKEKDYQALAALGIKTVIDLRADPEDYEKPVVESLGMRYVNIPMIEKKYPSAEQVEQFLKLANDPGTGKFYVHCAGGRHRTGVMGAVYRFTHDGWNFDQVYAEMKQYDFYTRWGHGDFKKFVEDYWQHIQANGSGAAAVNATAFHGGR
ncbi:MAG TPA: tyrosine-protein phosphatase [Pyrinomonadaceae bacterium]|jgi:protein tyrosine/serine phosphatase|nr:tyrosine-protein phosphatase [Pyrinomonadaceae bacterium]